MFRQPKSGEIKLSQLQKIRFEWARLWQRRKASILDDVIAWQNHPPSWRAAAASPDCKTGPTPRLCGLKLEKRQLEKMGNSSRRDKTTAPSITVHRERFHPVLRIRIRIFLSTLDSDLLSQRDGSGSGSFSDHAKIIRKILFPTVLWLFYGFLSLKNEVNIPSKSKKLKNVASWRSMTKIAGSGYLSQRHGSADLDPYQNVTSAPLFSTVKIDKILSITPAIMKHTKEQLRPQESPTILCIFTFASLVSGGFKAVKMRMLGSE